MAMRMGEYLVSIGALTEAQVNQVLQMQKDGDSRKFGELAIAQGFMGESAIKKFNEYVSAN